MLDKKKKYYNILEFLAAHLRIMIMQGCSQEFWAP